MGGLYLYFLPVYIVGGYFSTFYLYNCDCHHHDYLVKYYYTSFSFSLLYGVGLDTACIRYNMRDGVQHDVEWRYCGFARSQSASERLNRFSININSYLV